MTRSDRYDREKLKREVNEWQNARPGFAQTETVYFIEYQEPGDDRWLSASPFTNNYNHDETESYEEAVTVADGIRAGTHALYLQTTPGKYPVARTRIGERTHSAKLLREDG